LGSNGVGRAVVVMVATTRVEEGEDEVLRLEVAMRHTVAMAEPKRGDLCFKGKEKR